MLKIFNQPTPKDLESVVDTWCNITGPILIEQMSYTVFTNAEGQLTYSVALYYSEIIYDMS